MRWSLPLGRIAGIPIRVHVTFFLLLVLIYVLAADHFESAAAGMFAVLATCLLFGCVLLHELGHSLAAALFGTRTRGIILLPIGGVALLEQIPREPQKEITIALAGPFVSALLALLFWVLARQPPFPYPMNEVPVELSSAGMVHLLYQINVFLIGFNLIPAFPMDGGRVLRAILTVIVGWETGTRWAARLGQVLACGFVLVGFTVQGYAGLFIVGIFIFFGAGEEERLARARASLERATVEQAMLRSFATLPATATLLEALHRSVQHNQSDFPVFQGDRLLGVAPHERVIEAIRRHGPGAPVAVATVVNVLCASPADDLEELYVEILKRGRITVPVLQDGQLVGIMSWEQINRFARVRREIRDLLRRSARRGVPAASVSPSPDPGHAGETSSTRLSERSDGPDGDGPWNPACPPS